MSPETRIFDPHLLDLEVLNRDGYLCLKSRSIFSILFLSSFAMHIFILFLTSSRRAFFRSWRTPSLGHPASFHLSQASFFCLHKLESVESLYHFFCFFAGLCRGKVDNAASRIDLEIEIIWSFISSTFLYEASRTFVTAWEMRS